MSERAICLRGRFVLEGESSVYHHLLPSEDIMLPAKQKNLSALIFHNFNKWQTNACVWNYKLKLLLFDGKKLPAKNTVALLN